MALLHALVQLQPMHQNPLHVATLNHGIRGAAAAQDVATVQQLAAQFGLPCTTGYRDVPALAQQRGLSLEAAAREARYGFLVEVAARIGTTTIVTAHHANDQVETIVLHILRGSSLQGLRGMSMKAPVPGHPDYTLLRPLLSVFRSEIERYCAQHRLHFRQDSSNRDEKFLRNALRLDIVPRLRQVNPQVDQAILRLADMASVELDFIEQHVAQHVLPHIRRTTQRAFIDKSAFLGWHPALQRRALLHSATALGTAPTYERIQAAVALATTGNQGAISQLGGGVRLRLDYEHMVVEDENAPLPEGNYWLIKGEAPVPCPGEARLLNGVLYIHERPQPDTIAQLSLPPAATVTLRTRHPGDRFQPLGMGGQSRSLKKWFIDHKIPQHLRDSIPLLTVNEKIAAIVLPHAWIIAEPFAITPHSQHIFYFSVRNL